MSNRFVLNLVLVLFAGSALAQPAGKHDLEFTAQGNYPVKRVEWIVVDDIDTVCKGFAPLMEGRRYVGCTFFNSTSCRVYTDRNTSLSVLGHEIRHCFEGQRHK